VLRPKKQKFTKNSTKNGKNLLLQTKILRLLHGPIFDILWEKIIFPSKTSSHRLQLTYITKKKKKKVDVRVLTTNRTTVEADLGGYTYNHSDYRTVSHYWVLLVYVTLIWAVWADDGDKPLPF
jgi:hypothetical protein